VNDGDAKKEQRKDDGDGVQLKAYSVLTAKSGLKHTL